MASIDKIYGNALEYQEFYAWCESNYNSLCEYFYEPREDLEEHEVRPLTNFPTDADVWLVKHCQIGWVLDRIREQYHGLPSIKRAEVYNILKIKPYIFSDVMDMGFNYFKKPNRETIFTFVGNMEYRPCFIGEEDLDV